MSASAQRKAVTSHQLKLRMVNVNVNASDPAPVASGLDKSQIKEVIKVSPTVHTVVLKYPFNKSNQSAPHGQVTSLTDGVTHAITASDYDRMTITSSAAGDFSLQMIGSDFKFTY